jgi:hypothetical protein
MVLLALPPADHLLIERDRDQFVPSRRRRMMANVRAERLLKIPAEPSPELLSTALQLKREWSPWPEFGSDPGNPRADARNAGHPHGIGRHQERQGRRRPLGLSQAVRS